MFDRELIPSSHRAVWDYWATTTTTTTTAAAAATTTVQLRTWTVRVSSRPAAAAAAAALLYTMYDGHTHGTHTAHTRHKGTLKKEYTLDSTERNWIRRPTTDPHISLKKSKGTNERTNERTEKKTVECNDRIPAGRADDVRLDKKEEEEDEEEGKRRARN